MSATSTVLRTETETPTGSQSLVMMRNLIRTAISSVAYMRGIFEENCFSDRVLAGVNIKILAKTTKNSEAQLLCKWLEDGVFDALNKKYVSCPQVNILNSKLRRLIFGVYEDQTKTDSLIECYHFNFSYPDKDKVVLELQKKGSKSVVSSQIQSTKIDVRKATVLLLRTLITMTPTLKPLPDERVLTMKLLYYDDRTPEDYQPPFFREAQAGMMMINFRHYFKAGSRSSSFAESSNINRYALSFHRSALVPSYAVLFADELAFDKKPLQIRIGNVGTPFHAMDLKIHTASDTFQEELDMDRPIKDRVTKMRWSMESDEEEEEAPAEDCKDPSSKSASSEETESSETEDQTEQKRDSESQDSDDDDLWQRTVQLIRNLQFISLAHLSRSLAVSYRTAKDLMQRLEQANLVAEFHRGKGRRVLKKNLPSEEPTKSKEKDSDELCCQLQATVLTSEADQSHSETQPSQIFTLKAKKTSVPPPAQQEMSKRVQKRLAKFDFSESQETQSKVKASIIKEPIVQKKKRRLA